MSRLLLVNYHYVRGGSAYRHPGIHPLAPAALAAQIEALTARLHPATPGEVAAFARDPAALPRPAFFLTFDDGLVDHAQAAREVLARRGLRAAFFVNTRPLAEGRGITVHKLHWLRAHTEPEAFRQEFLALLPAGFRALEQAPEVVRAAREVNRYDRPEIARLKYMINFHLPYALVDEATGEMLARRGLDEAAFCVETYMSGADLVALQSDGHVVACHGHSHRPLSRLRPAERDADVARNLDCLTALLGRRPRWLSYPWGSPWSIPDDAEALCRRFGFEIGITLIRRWNEGGESPFRLFRVNTNEVPAILEELDAADPGAQRRPSQR